MHFIFIPYGMKDWVDKLIRDMQSQKHPLILHKEGEPDQMIYIESQIRVLPFGLYEYVFPREDMDAVLATLCGEKYDPDKSDSYTISRFKLKLIRKMIKAEPVPQFKRDKRFIWMKQNVGIIPIGVRYDGDIVEPEGSLSAGWTHERI